MSKTEEDSTLHSESQRHSYSGSDLEIRSGGDKDKEASQIEAKEMSNNKVQEVQQEQRTDGPDEYGSHSCSFGSGDIERNDKAEKLANRGTDNAADKEQYNVFSNSNSPRSHSFGREDAERTDKAEGTINDEENEVIEKEKRTDGLDDQTNLMPRSQVIVVFMGVSSALFISLLDQTVISTALPDISSEFEAAGVANWVATSYLLTSTAVITFWSRLSDLIGRKLVLQINLVIFFFGSLACALSTTITMLVGFRALAGLGGGGILNNVMVIISDIVSLRERGKWQGLIGVIVAISNSLGPILGGVFTETIGWRWIFWINLPLTGAAVIIVQLFLPQKRISSSYREKIKRIDYLGTILVLASTTLVLLSLNWGGNEYAWDSAVVIALLVVGVVLMGVFVFVESSKFINLPILPMHLFKNMSVSASYACTFFSGLIFYGALYFLPQYLQVVKGYSPLRSGVVLLGLILTQTLFSFTSGMIVSKTGNYRINIWSGFIVWTVGLGLFTMLDPSTQLANFIGYSVIAGFGAGNTFQTTLLSVQAAVKRQELAVATGGRNFIRLLGGTIGLALCDVILRNTLIVGLREIGTSESTIDEITDDPTAIRNVVGIDAAQVIRIYCNGIRNIFILFTAASGASFLISLLIRHYALDKPDDKILKEEGKEWNEQRKMKKRLKAQKT